jgi:hypothetical protein
VTNEIQTLSFSNPNLSLSNGGGTVNLSALGGLTGSGTTGFVPKFTSSSAIGNSLIRENADSVIITRTTNRFQGVILRYSGSFGPAVEDYGFGNLSLRAGGSTFILGSSSFARFFGLSAFTSAGDCGVGTTGPSDRLHVSGASARIRVQNTSAGGQTAIIFAGTGGVGFGNITNSQQFIVYSGTPNDALNLSTSFGYTKADYPLTIGGAFNNAMLHVQSIGNTSATSNALFESKNGTDLLAIRDDGKFTFLATNTAGGTTGNQTINRPSGTVNFAAGATTITVTNSLVTTSSIVIPVIRTNDTTATIKNVVPASGSFTITLNAAATGETSVGFFVIN